VDASLLLLADGRFPSGGHAQSWGVEAACALGDVVDVGSLEQFVRGRLHTQGWVDGGVAAWVCRRGERLDDATWTALDHEISARMASPRLRTASRAQGRQMLRAGQRVWPSPHYAPCRAAHPDGPHQAAAFAAVAAGAGLDPAGAALCALHHLVASATTAAVRLLGLDPFEVSALSAHLASDLDSMSVALAEQSRAWSDPAALPATVGLLSDVYAEHHATWEVRLFAS